MRYNSIIFRRSKRSMTIITQPYWIVSITFKKRKRPHLAKKKVFFHHDNEFTRARHRWPNSATNYFPIQHIRQILSPATISCFQTWQNVRRKEIHHQRAGHRRNRGLFWRVGQIILFGLKKLENRWIKCIELKGDYIEK